MILPLRLLILLLLLLLLLLLRRVSVDGTSRRRDVDRGLLPNDYSSFLHDNMHRSMWRRRVGAFWAMEAAARPSAGGPWRQPEVLREGNCITAKKKRRAMRCTQAKKSKKHSVWNHAHILSTRRTSIAKQFKEAMVQCLQCIIFIAPQPWPKPSSSLPEPEGEATRENRARSTQSDKSQSNIMQESKATVQRNTRKPPSTHSHANHSPTELWWKRAVATAASLYCRCLRRLAIGFVWAPHPCQKRQG